MSPISHERLQQVEGRLLVLDACHKQLIHRQNLYLASLPGNIPLTSRDTLLLTAVTELIREELLLRVERDVLIQLLQMETN